MTDTDKDIENIDKAEIVGIRTSDFDEFMDIWVVTFDGRMFARSWSRLKDSWFFAFKEQKGGFLKCGEKIYEVAAAVPEDFERISAKINNAYQRRYGHGETASIAKSMQDEKRFNMTMEFRIIKRVE